MRLLLAPIFIALLVFSASTAMAQDVCNELLADRNEVWKVLSDFFGTEKAQLKGSVQVEKRVVAEPDSGLEEFKQNLEFTSEGAQVDVSLALFSKELSRLNNLRITFFNSPIPYGLLINSDFNLNGLAHIRYPEKVRDATAFVDTDGSLYLRVSSPQDGYQVAARFKKDLITGKIVSLQVNVYNIRDYQEGLTEISNFNFLFEH